MDGGGSAPDGRRVIGPWKLLKAKKKAAPEGGQVREETPREGAKRHAGGVSYAAPQYIMLQARRQAAKGRIRCPSDSTLRTQEAYGRPALAERTLWVQPRNCCSPA